MTRFCVSISHLTDDQLEFLGYYVVKQDSEFKVYLDYMGEEHIVQTAKPLLRVDDVNDAVAMGATRFLQIT